MDDNAKSLKLNRRRRFYAFLSGAMVGFAVLFVLAKSLGFTDDPAFSVGVFGAAAGGVGGRIGARRGVKEALLGITLATLGAIAGSYFWYLMSISNP